MSRKCLLVLLIAAVVMGSVFAQEEENAANTESEEIAVKDKSAAKNTITVDLGPTIIGGVFKGVGNSLISEGDGMSASGFGIGVQYERQLIEKLSVGFRFAYLGFGIGFTDNANGIKTSADAKIYSMSFEGHARFYPAGKVFFLDGMLGYANMGMSLNGSMKGKDELGTEAKVEVSDNFLSNYFKYGLKLGWRIRSGKSKGGFTFEPSFGYYGGTLIGDTIGKKLSSKYDIDMDIDEVFNYVADFVLIGGPRLSLAFGWSF